MSYTKNPHLPKLRMEAVRLVKYRGWSTRAVARYTGFSQSAIVKWCAKDETGGWERIETKSSKPKHHPSQLSDELVAAIIAERLSHNRCGEHVQAALARRGVANPSSA
jgi:transposase